MTDEQMGELKRYFGVIADELRGEIRLVAEGHDVLRNEIQTFREENDAAHQEIVSLIRSSYSALDATHAALAARVERFERGAGHS
jgi:hypothetical protein